jgi:acetyl-CoA acetyltransferase
MFHLEQVADLAAQALRDSGLKADQIDGLAINGPHFHEASSFVPAMAAEYLGLSLHFGEVVDLGGTSGVGMIWRAAAAIELGVCQAVLCVIPQRMAPMGPHDDPNWMMKAMRYGGHSAVYGAPEAEFDLPYGHLGQNTGYAMIAQRHMAEFGTTRDQLGAIVTACRNHGAANPHAQLRKPLTLEQYRQSRPIVAPLTRDDICLVSDGAAAVVVLAGYALWTASGLLGSIFTFGSSSEPSEGLADSLKRHEQLAAVDAKRFNGRSAFFAPPAPVRKAPKTVKQPEPPKPTKGTTGRTYRAWYPPQSIRKIVVDSIPIRKR